MSENLNEPQSRTEEILQNALGEEYDVTPQSRVEKLLTQIFEEGAGGAEIELLASTTSEESFVDGNTLHASGIVTSLPSVGTDGVAPGYNIPNSSIPSSVYNKLTKSNLGIGIMHFYYLNGPSSSDVKCVSIPCNIIKSNGYVRLEPSGAMYQPLWQGSWALSYDIAIPII